MLFFYERLSLMHKPSHKASGAKTGNNSPPNENTAVKSSDP